MLKAYRETPPGIPCYPTDARSELLRKGSLCSRPATITVMVIFRDASNHHCLTKPLKCGILKGRQYYQVAVSFNN